MVLDLSRMSLFFFNAGAWAQGRTLISIISLYSYAGDGEEEKEDEVGAPNSVVVVDGLDGAEETIVSSAGSSFSFFFSSILDGTAHL